MTIITTYIADINIIYNIYRRYLYMFTIRLFSAMGTGGFYMKSHIKKLKKVLAICGCMDYNSTCCDIDSVEAEVAER